MEIEVGSPELVDDHYPLAVAAAEVSSALPKKISEFTEELAPDEVRGGQVGIEVETNPTPYAFKIDKLRSQSWEPELEFRSHILSFDHDDEPMGFGLEAPFAVQARHSDIPELAENDVPDVDQDLMELLNQRDSIYPGIVTISLDELPSRFTVTDVTFIERLR